MTDTTSSTDADLIESAISGSVSGAIAAVCLVLVATVVVVIVTVSLVMCGRHRRKSKPMVLLPFTNDAACATVLRQHKPMDDEGTIASGYRAYSNITETNVDMLRYANEGLFKESDRDKHEKDEDTFWEPADTVNELYKQLSSKKYKEITREDLQYVIKH